MPSRRRPQAAFIGLASASALIAATAGLRGPDAVATLASSTSIDNTLTRDDRGCAGVRSTVWHPLSGVDYTGRLRMILPARFGGAISLYVGDVFPLDIEASTDDGEPVATNAERMVNGPGVQLPPDFWLDDGSPLEAPRYITRLLIDASGERDRAITLALGRRAPRVFARLVGYPPTARIPICAQAIQAREVYFGSGWYGEERDSIEGTVRWMRDHGAVLVSSTAGRDATVRVRLAPAGTAMNDEPVHLTVRVNDTVDLEPVSLAAGFHEYEWQVPDSSWLPGTNELLFTVSQTRKSGTRTLGLALASLDVH